MSKGMSLRDNLSGKVLAKRKWDHEPVELDVGSEDEEAEAELSLERCDLEPFCCTTLGPAPDPLVVVLVADVVDAEGDALGVCLLLPFPDCSISNFIYTVLISCLATTKC